MFRSLLPPAIAIVVLAGCDYMILLDQKGEIDRYVNESAVGRQPRSAVEFLTSNGKLDGVASEADRAAMVMLCQRLQKEYKLEPIVMVEPDGGDFAVEVVMKAPVNAETRNSIELAIQEADANFAGMIRPEWGNQWLVVWTYVPDDLSDADMELDADGE